MSLFYLDPIFFPLWSTLTSSSPQIHFLLLINTNMQYLTQMLNSLCSRNSYKRDMTVFVLNPFSYHLNTSIWQLYFSLLCKCVKVILTRINMQFTLWMWIDYVSSWNIPISHKVKRNSFFKVQDYLTFPFILGPLCLLTHCPFFKHRLTMFPISKFI